MIMSIMHDGALYLAGKVSGTILECPLTKEKGLLYMSIRIIRSVSVIIMKIHCGEIYSVAFIFLCWLLSFAI